MRDQTSLWRDKPSKSNFKDTGAEAQRPTKAGANLDRVVIFMMLAHPRGRARQLPQHQSGWPLFFALMSFFLTKQSLRNLSARRWSQLVPVTPAGGVGSRCPLARAIVRAVTATKHERGSLPSFRVVSYSSAPEVWVFLMRFSHCQRARSEGFAVVPL